MNHFRDFLKLHAVILSWGLTAVLGSMTSVPAVETVLLRTVISVFTINLYSNLESVYGILLGALLLGEWQQLNGGFYAGAAVICTAVLVQPLVSRKLSPPAATTHAPVAQTNASGTFYDTHPSVS